MQPPIKDEEDDDDDDKFGPSFEHIPWDDVLFLCIEHRMKDWCLLAAPVTNGEELVLKVIFKKEDYVGLHVYTGLFAHFTCFSLL